MIEFEDDSTIGEEWFGHGGTEMPSYDWSANYSESHFCETDERYMDKESEDTEATNQRALRELEEFNRILEEEADEEEEWLSEQAELEDFEEEARTVLEENDAAWFKAESEEDKEKLKEICKESHANLDNASYDVGHHIRGI